MAATDGSGAGRAAFGTAAQEFARRAKLAPVKVVTRLRVAGCARGARTRSGLVIYVDKRAVDAKIEVQRFLAAHEIARLALDKPRLPGLRFWSAVSLVLLCLAFIIAAPFLLAVSMWLYPVGLAFVLAAGLGCLAGVRQARRNQRAADRYAVDQLGASLKDAWYWLFITEDRWRPAWLDTEYRWHQRPGLVHLPNEVTPSTTPDQS